jgi:predicted thioesterase
LLGTTRTVRYFTRPTDSVGAVPDGPEWTTKPDILRSGRMVEWCEGPCMAAIRTGISTDECSLGVLQQFQWLHEAPVRTSEVEQVTITVTCTDVNGRRTNWDVIAHDANLVELGRGSMEFVVTDQARYQVRHGLIPVRTA